MPGTTSSRGFVAGFRKRGLGLARVLLALVPKLFNQRFAVAVEAACPRALLPAALAALATDASSSRCVVRPSVTGSFGVMFAMFQ